jgi:hypothetical protein
VTYRVILDVQSRILPTLLQTIDGNADIKLVAVTDAQNPALPPSPLPPTPAALQPSINAVPQRHIRADALIEETLRSARGKLGFEAFGANEKSLGIFPNEKAAADAISEGTP